MNYSNSKMLSIVLPVYNCAPWVASCLDSIRAQTFTDWECICVDDGSTDGSLDILARYAKLDPRFKVISQTNQGSARARNRGLSLATGIFLMFCDADDRVSPSWCEKLVDAMQTSHADFVQCYVDLDCSQLTVEQLRGRPIMSEAYLNPPRRLGLVRFQSHGFHRAGVNVLLWNKIFRLAKIRSEKISFPECRYHEDDYFVAAYMLCSVGYVLIPNRLYRYILQPAGLTNQQQASKRSHLDYAICFVELVRWLLPRHPERRGWLIRIGTDWLRFCATGAPAGTLDGLCRQLNATLETCKSGFYVVLMPHGIGIVDLRKSSLSAWGGYLASLLSYWVRRSPKRWERIVSRHSALLVRRWKSRPVVSET